MATFAKRVLQIEEQESQAKELSEDTTPQTTRRSSTAALSSASAAMARIELAIANLKSPTKASSNHNIQSKTQTTPPTPLLTPFKSSPPQPSSTSPIDSPHYQETTKWKRMVVGQIAGLELSCESLQLQNTQLIIHNKLLEKKLQQSQRDNRALREALGEKISAPNPIQDATIAVTPIQNTSTPPTPTLQQPPAPVSPPPLPIVTEEEKKFQAEYLARQQQMFSSSSPMEESRIIQTTMEFNAVQTQLKHLKQVLSIAKMDNYLQGKNQKKNKKSKGGYHYVVCNYRYMY